jgi:hypothetical protein
MQPVLLEGLSKRPTSMYQSLDPGSVLSRQTSGLPGSAAELQQQLAAVAVCTGAEQDAAGAGSTHGSSAAGAALVAAVGGLRKMFGEQMLMQLLRLHVTHLSTCTACAQWSAAAWVDAVQEGFMRLLRQLIMTTSHSAPPLNVYCMLLYAACAGFAGRKSVGSTPTLHEPLEVENAISIGHKYSSVDSSAANRTISIIHKCSSIDNPAFVTDDVISSSSQQHHEGLSCPPLLEKGLRYRVSTASSLAPAAAAAGIGSSGGLAGHQLSNGSVGVSHRQTPLGSKDHSGERHSISKPATQ